MTVLRRNPMIPQGFLENQHRFTVLVEDTHGGFIAS